MSTRLRVGAIGAGWWATTNHLPILAAREDVELVAVCSTDASSLDHVQSEFGFTVATDDYRALLGLELDAVVVSSPHHLHYEHARAALDRGLHVLCEKPMTLHADEAWDLVARADQGDCHLLIPFGWNFAPFVVAAASAMEELGVGEVQFAQCQMASPTKDFFAGSGEVPTQWTGGIAAPNPRTWQDPAAGGGYAHGQLSHAVALLLWLTGLRGASALAVSTSPQSAVDLYDAAVVTFDNGAIGSLGGAATLTADDKFQLDIRIFGSEGVLLLDVERERVELRRHDGQRWYQDVPPGEGGYACVEPVTTFVDLALGRPVTNRSPGELGARTVEVIEAITQSSSHGGERVTVTSTRNKVQAN